ncbi:hypothetical protein TNIN_119111, partial [Trichonephila inaurata madagascariensis]
NLADVLDSTHNVAEEFEDTHLGSAVFNSLIKGLVAALVGATVLGGADTHDALQPLEHRFDSVD